MPKKSKEKKDKVVESKVAETSVPVLNLTDRLRPNALVSQLDDILARLDAIEKQLKNK
jgi:hypothetical protein